MSSVSGVSGVNGVRGVVCYARGCVVWCEWLCVVRDVSSCVLWCDLSGVCVCVCVCGDVQMTGVKVMPFTEDMLDNDSGNFPKKFPRNSRTFPEISLKVPGKFPRKP